MYFVLFLPFERNNDIIYTMKKISGISGKSQKEVELEDKSFHTQ